MRVLIVEDERMAQARLAQILDAHFPDLKVVGMCSSVSGTLEWLRNPGNKADIIFMDVELSDGDCFGIFRQHRVDANVIMTTAYDSYAIKAFEAGSVDYLLKPIEIQDLERAVSRCRQKTAPVDVEGLLKALQDSRKPAYRERYVVRSGDMIIPVPCSRICWFVSEDKSNYLTDSDGHRYIIDSSMDSLDSELDPEMFFRISRGCIVNRSCIQSVSRHFSGKLRIAARPEPPFEMTVSRGRVEDFLKWLE